MLSEATVRTIEKFAPRRLLELLLVLLLSVLIYVQNYQPIESWLVSHWLFDYEHGFTKRGLVGELLRLAQHDISYREIELISFGLGLVLALQVAYLAFIVYKRVGNPLVPILILFAPFTITQIADNGGRFDTINSIILITFLLLPRYFQGVALAAVLSILMLLIHEGSFVQLPLLWVVASYDGKRVNRQPFLVLFCISVVALGPILTFSRLNIGEDEFLAYLKQKLPPTGTEATDEHFGGYQVLFYSSSFVIRTVLSLAFSPKGIEGIFTVATFVIGWLKLTQVIPRYLNLKAADTTLLFLIGSSPLLLVGISWDWYRWCSLMAIMALASTAFLVLQEESATEPAEKERDRRALHQSSIYFIFLFAISLTPFPDRYPGQLRDGIQCLAADYNLLWPPMRMRCPGADFKASDTR